MLKRNVMLAVTLSVALVQAVPASAQSLTDQDRAEIQKLVADYATALGSCNAEGYASLFAPNVGYFASNIRGELVGRERLMALVQSERHCIPAAAPAAGAAPQGRGNAPGGTPGGRAGGQGAARPTPTAVIEPTPTGAKGRADLGQAGGYEDEYVKTPQGWKFKSRTVITGQEKAAGLTVQDVTAIRRLAGTDLGLFGDLYVPGPDGVNRFRTSGVETRISPEGVIGKAYLKAGGGHYDDVYVRTPQGGWRFQSRLYVADEKPVDVR